jgi:3'(2'), 5'-bisphosphate nucleotidase
MPPAGDGGFARWLASRAGDLLRRLREEITDPDTLRAAGDKRSHDLIMSELERWRPADAVLSEEGVHDNPARLGADRVWIVDPLDGTREYGEPGRTDWAVHIGLWCGSAARGRSGDWSWLPGEARGQDWSEESAVKRPEQAGRGRLTAGAVALPAQHRVLATDSPPAYPPLDGNRRPRLLASRTRAPAFLTELAAHLDAELVPMGSAGAKVAAVVAGDADAYVHAGGMYEWDSAAPVAVATATGLHASRLDGARLEYNQADPLLPDLVVCRKDLAPRLLAALTRIESR